MITIRSGVFETNSSSTHSLNICTEDEFNKWINGELLYDDWNEEFVENSEGNKGKTYEEFGDSDWAEFFEKYFETPSGDKMVAFGYYGYNG